MSFKELEEKIKGINFNETYEQEYLLKDIHKCFENILKRYRKNHKEELIEKLTNAYLNNSFYLQRFSPFTETLTRLAITNYLNYNDRKFNPNHYSKKITKEKLKRELKKEFKKLETYESNFEKDIAILPSKEKKKMIKRLKETIIETKRDYDINGLNYDLYKKMNQTFNGYFGFKEINNYIIGSEIQTSGINSVPRDLGEIIIAYEFLGDYLKKQIHPIEKAIRTHYTSLIVHPYEDGNGRLMRLLMNVILTSIKNIIRFPSIYFDVKEREEYLKKLMYAQKAFIERRDKKIENIEATRYVIISKNGFEVKKIKGKFSPTYTDTWLKVRLKHNILFLLGLGSMLNDFKGFKREQLEKILDDHINKALGNTSVFATKYDVLKIIENTPKNEIKTIKQLFLEKYLIKSYYGTSKEEQDFANYIENKILNAMNVKIEY